MLNLAKFLCLLLVAKATSAAFFDSLESAQKSFDEAMESSLAKMDKYHTQNVACVKSANLSLQLEMPHSQSAHESRWSRLKFSRGSDRVTKATKKNQALLSGTSKALETTFKTERSNLENRQHLAEACVSSHPDTFGGRRESVMCIDEVRESLLEKVKEAKIHFAKLCKEAKTIAKTALTQLKGIQPF